MKIQIRNLGPIHEFEFDLDKQVHVLYGKNNIGKSYAISTVYLILKNILNTEIDNKIRQYSDDGKELLDKIKRKIEVNKTETTDITDLYKEFFLQVMLPVVRAIEKSLISSYGSILNLKNKNSQATLSIRLIFDKIFFEIGVVDEHLTIIKSNFYFKKNVTVKKVKTSRQEYHGKKEFRFYIRGSSTQAYWSLYQKLKFYPAKAIIDRIKKARLMSNNVYFLPASRSGLYSGMSVFSSVFAQLSQVRHAFNEKIEIPSLPEATSDYFLNLANINSKLGLSTYEGYARQIEQEILQAEITFNETRKTLEYHNSSQKLNLDLSMTSSMVSELAPIVAYLKYVIRKPSTSWLKNYKTVLFIEEPEAHLHPEVQLKLTEIFAKLSKANVKIVMTTHSNYIFNKINNLILKGELKAEDVASYHMIHTDKGSIVSDKSKPTATGIEDENFVTVAEQLYNERLETLESVD